MKIPGWLWVVLGGAVGSGLRYGVLQLLALLNMGNTPWPVLLVNVTGCGLFGYLSPNITSPSIRLLVLSGLLGGFTTFSSYIQDVNAVTVLPLPALGWLVLSPIAGYLAYWAGASLVNRF